MTDYYFVIFFQIANSNPLVSERQDLSVLQREYADDDTVYQLKIKVNQISLVLRVILQGHLISDSRNFQVQGHFKRASLQQGV